MTVLTWNQFLPRLADFGRRKLPRKWGRVLRRLSENYSLREAKGDTGANPQERPPQDA